MLELLRLAVFSCHHVWKVHCLPIIATARVPPCDHWNAAQLLVIYLMSFVFMRHLQFPVSALPTLVVIKNDEELSK